MPDLPLGPLYSPRVVSALLEKHGLRPTKSFGQNFLIDGNILRQIVEAGEVGPGDTVYEVGPGLGVLTRALAETGAQVTALEKDEHLKNVLAETLEGLNLKVVWGDALEFDWAGAPQGSILVANLPYYISTAILSRIMGSGRFARATFLVQREVAERLIAAPGTENYGFLSALTGLYGKAKIVRNVPKTAFLPAPDVTSSIVRVDFSGSLPEPGLLKLLEASLAYRRKTLKNNLEKAGYPLENLNVALEHLKLSPSVRGEALSLEQLQTLYRFLQLKL
ncbi:MAG: 16S rRNA (adenine(1518)-N(6)/adenine(1519)-N(6))-dimethyltransferase RsmA [Pseudopedobacter sp.]|nr:16S rRNA (adenine(1518)-N(6)/adenine(1519)-N(6))-dimethyltransferase RsmA [Deinococcales bacterium]